MWYVFFLWFLGLEFDYWSLRGKRLVCEIFGFIIFINKFI